MLTSSHLHPLTLLILLHEQVIERCEDLLSKCKNDSSAEIAVTRAELLSSMESLLKVTKKLLEESKNM